ncbi:MULTISPECIES: hypothetical protein [unclassified Pseudomonas]|uniref:hypothetical protein n=1 Tax=unclassified Pseudomonas TaxID=196821 RepID=UPI001E384FB0|nr:MULTISPECIES: hypothetical protein [unclassified Pseudomonas]MCE0915819.1 hypothetical protein [Pseudomonas sp. NMI760_13]MCP8632084.1 hypothetical protein [Pseudomonas sp. DVZ6]MDC0687070.1 hypothetical protein [Mitsuaria sp. RG]MDD7783086.1 hypothetical protein [Pseudomonas sp. DVZ24]
MSNSDALNSFVRKLQDPAFFAKVGPSFALLAPGDWHGLLRWSEALGYSFTLAELHALCLDNPQILEPLAGSEHLRNWSQVSLTQLAKGL